MADIASLIQDYEAGKVTLFREVLPQCMQMPTVAILQAAQCPATKWECICDPATGVLPGIFTLFPTFCGKSTDAYDGMRGLYNHCGIEDTNETEMVLTFTVVFAALALAAVFLRFLIRLKPRARLWGHDDTIMLVALPIFIFHIVSQLLMVNSGLGKDIWDLKVSSVVNFAKYFYWNELSYIVLTMLMKLCVLTFYLRLFQTGVIRHLIYFLMGFTVVSLTGCFFAYVFQCKPVHYRWQLWGDDPPTPSRYCPVERHLLNLGYGMINIILDSIIVGLPAPKLYKLRVGWLTKLRVMACFFAGTCVVIFASIRLGKFVGNASRAKYGWNITRELVPLSCWSIIELTASMICASMPHFYFLGRYIYHTCTSRADTVDSRKEIAVLGLPQENRWRDEINANDENMSIRGLPRVKLSGV